MEARERSERFCSQSNRARSMSGFASCFYRDDSITQESVINNNIEHVGFWKTLSQCLFSQAEPFILCLSDRNNALGWAVRLLLDHD